MVPSQIKNIKDKWATHLNRGGKMRFPFFFSEYCDANEIPPYHLQTYYPIGTIVKNASFKQGWNYSNVTVGKTTTLKTYMKLFNKHALAIHFTNNNAYKCKHSGQKGTFDNAHLPLFLVQKSGLKIGDRVQAKILFNEITWDITDIRPAPIPAKPVNRLGQQLEKLATVISPLNFLNGR